MRRWPRDTDLPQGWTARAGDGAFVHTESGVACLPAFGAFTRQKLEGPSSPNILGICIYADAKGRPAGVRVRRYMENVGDSPLAIQNDRNLISPPNGQHLVATMRVTPVALDDGTHIQRLTFTVLRNGMLTDCFAVMDQETTGDLLKLCDRQ